MRTAAENELARVLTGMQAMMQRQYTGLDQLAAQAATVDDRFASGEANLVTAMTSFEKRLSESEKKLTDALGVLASTMTGFKSGLEQRLAASDARLDAALQQLTAVMAAAVPVPGSSPQPAAPAGAQAAATATGQLDPWGQFAASSAAGGPASSGPAPTWPSAAAAVLNASVLRTKESPPRHAVRRPARGLP